MLRHTETKAKMAADIADHLDLPAPAVSNGSSVAGKFLGAVARHLTGDDRDHETTYRRAEAALAALGETYDPYWDTSEEGAEKGGGTVTNRTFSRVKAALTSTPRCFILNLTDHKVGEKYADTEGEQYGFDKDVSGREALLDAGPGSVVLFYRTAKSRSGTRKAFVAHAAVRHIGPGWKGPEWTATLSDYEALADPVSSDDVEIVGWNRRVSLVEITWDTYQAIVGAGGTQPLNPYDSAEEAAGRAVPIAQQALDNPAKPATGAGPDQPSADKVPDQLPVGVLDVRDLALPNYDASDARAGARDPFEVGRSPERQRLDRLAEKRAVEVTIAALKADGWELTGDRQKDGVGYDLEFTKGQRMIHVEVKGIQGKNLEFNLTAKEWWRVQTDDQFILAAVTTVLSPAFRVRLVTRETIAAAEPRLVALRVKLDEPPSADRDTKAD